MKMAHVMHDISDMVGIMMIIAYWIIFTVIIIAILAVIIFAFVPTIHFGI